MDRSPPEPSVHGILQAWTLEWVARPFRRGPSRPRDYTCGPVARPFRRGSSRPRDHTCGPVARPFPRGSSRPRDYTCGPVSLLHRQAGSLPLVSPGKPAFWFSLFKNLV